MRGNATTGACRNIKHLRKKLFPAMSSDEQPVRERRRHRGAGFIPAGIFIGLGAGILFDHLVSGMLIGLGLGFIISALVSGHEDQESSAGTTDPYGFMKRDWTMILLGIFIMLVGIALVWAPLLVWPYIFAAFFILIGIGFVLRGLRK
jgi:hypothetical protein